MEGFGPYVDKTVIDFESTERLTLISGPTGSGKTTIFDGICCALYGDPSGSRKFSQMHSKNRDVRTRVAFDFELNGKRYHIERSPGYTEGKRKYSAEALLELPDGGIVQKSKEATKKVEEILGITKKEFGQIVMIAQNDFMAMLLQTSGEQEKTFNRIFGLTLYEHFDQKVKKEFESAKSDSALAAEKLKGLSDYGTDEPVTHLKEDLQKSQSDEDRLLGEREELTEEIDAFYLKKEAVLRQEELQKQQKAFLVQKENLDQNYPEIKKLEDRLTLLERVQSLKTPYEDILKLKDEIEAIKQKIFKDQRILKAKRNELTKTDEALKAFDKEDLETLKKNIAVDESRLSFYKERDKKKEELEELRNQAREKIKKKNVLLTQIGTLESEKIDVLPQEGIVAELYENKNALEKVKVQIKEVESVEKARSQDLKLQEEQNRSKEALLKDKEVFLSAQEDYQTAFARFLDDQAAALALRLVEGKPCPVCGSTVHPNPKTEKTGEEVDLKKLETLRDEKRTIYEKAKKNFESLTRQREDLKEQLERTDVVPLEELRLKKQTFENKDQELSQKEALNKERIKQEENRKGKIQSLKDDLTALNEAYLKIKQRGEYLSEELKQDLPSYQTAVDNLNALKIELSQRQDRLKELEDLKQNLTMETVRLKESLKSCSEELALKLDERTRLCKDLKESLTREKLSALLFNELLGELDKIDVYRKRIMDHYSKLETIKAQLEVIDKKLDKAQTDLGLDLEETESRLLGRRDNLERSLERIKINIEELKEKLKEAEKFYPEYLKLVEKVDTLGVLNDTVNRRGQTFAQFVLSYYFKRILERANKRLYTVSLGRYSLIQPEPGKLGLEVFDAQNNKSREVSTLSGGETFFTSLSLALGFSEIVEEEYGGVRLDTIFIDEGFGSLDPDHLERAIEVLLNLTGERRVFVISHVESLKELIDGQIVVEKKKDHSEIRT